MTTQQAVRLVQNIEGIGGADFSIKQNGTLSGVVFDKVTGQEYDVRHVPPSTWIVNDDAGADHRGLSIQQAIARARSANKEGS